MRDVLSVMHTSIIVITRSATLTIHHLCSSFIPKLRAILTLTVFITTLASIASESNARPTAKSSNTTSTTASSTSIVKHQVKNIDGESISLSDYKGKVLLIVNTASRCGYTSQYKDLVALQTTYSAKGFSVLAFPCNDFGGQEPGSAQEIKTFCDTSFNINFPLFEKLHARGDKKSPLYQTLTALPPPLGGEIRWNFTKFLVDTQGQVIARFEPGDSPTSDQVKRAIETALKSNL